MAAINKLATLGIKYGVSVSDINELHLLETEHVARQQGLSLSDLRSVVALSARQYQRLKSGSYSHKVTSPRHRITKAKQYATGHTYEWITDHAGTFEVEVEKGHKLTGRTIAGRHPEVVRGVLNRAGIMDQFELNHDLNMPKLFKQLLQRIRNHYGHKRQFQEG